MVGNDHENEDEPQAGRGKKRGADSLVVISLFAGAILFLIALLYIAY